MEIFKGGMIRRAGERNGHLCPKCKKVHPWPLYVFAHWDMTLSHTCDCGVKVAILRGVATRL